MARKSRKHLIENPIEKKIPSAKMYSAAGYLRLSVAKENQPSESIENQKKIIEAFINTCDDILLHKFYIDENASGGTFERKAFQAMLDDIAKGEIDCILVKDLSRLGREHIETGFYLERYFPTRGVRFITIGDRFDTVDGLTNISFEKLAGLKITITNIFNESIIKDIRKKTQASIDVNVREGKYVAPRAPYGYMKAPTDCHALIPDQKAAMVVKEIFGMATKKVGLNEIVRRLNISNISTPIDYARANGLQGNYEHGNGLWNTRTVKYILTNRTYVGDLGQGKDRFAVENTHEPLVSRDIFNDVQKLLVSASDAQSKTNTPRIDNILRGKVICGSCGGKMQRRKSSGKGDWYFFTCITNNRLGAGYCTGMYIREANIMDALRLEAAKYVKENKSLALEYECGKLALINRRECINVEFQEISDNASNLYEQFVNGFISVDEYRKHKDKCDIIKMELCDIERNISVLDTKQRQYQLFCDVSHNSDDFEQLVNSYLLTSTIHEDKQIDISFC